MAERAPIMDVSIDCEPAADDDGVEVAEHKGVGHPDSICDALAEASARALGQAYLDRFGRVLHHNVDKALLVGGSARAFFGGGEILAPIEIDVAGRVTEGVDAEAIVRATCAEHLRRSMHALDVDRHVKLRARLRAGSADLRALFDAGVPSANDTSCGAAYAPLSLVDRVVLAVADRLRAAATAKETAFVGEDVKVMGVRRDRRVELTVACALVSLFVRDVNAHAEAIATIESMARAAAAPFASELDELDVTVNAADEPSKERFYLTLTGTSAESGDDGEVGRGNRVNRLITPGRAMTLEATAGKNAVTHVGKLYTVAARELAERIVAQDPDAITHAEVLLVSRIGAPIDRPRLAHVRVRTHDGEIDPWTRRAIEAQVRETIAAVPTLAARILRGEITLF